MDLLREEKITIMRFICSFAWADLVIHDAERALVARFMDTLELDEKDRAIVQSFLERPPRPEDIDPMQLPKELRPMVLSAAEAMTVSDGEIDDRELELLALLHSLFDQESLAEDDVQPEN